MGSISRAARKSTLGDLTKKQTLGTTKALKKRVARRFSIIGEKHGFRVYVDGDEVIPSDRDYYDKIRYLWTYGDQRDVIALCSKAENKEDRTDCVQSDGITITGWLATVGEVRYLKDEEGDNLNRIAIFVRGKLAQEDMLTDFSERGVYASYLIGELHVDDMDKYDGPGTKEDEDAATNSRQIDRRCYDEQIFPIRGLLLPNRFGGPVHSEADGRDSYHDVRVEVINLLEIRCAQVKSLGGITQAEILGKISRNCGSLKGQFGMNESTGVDEPIPD